MFKEIPECFRATLRTFSDDSGDSIVNGSDAGRYNGDLRCSVILSLLETHTTDVITCNVRLELLVLRFILHHEAAGAHHMFLCTASCLHPFISRAHERVWLFCAAVERSEISPTVQAAAETQAGIKVCICFQGALEQLSERHGVLSLSQPFMFSSVQALLFFAAWQ